MMYIPTRYSKYLLVLPAILAAIPALVQLIFIYNYAHNIPVWEQWEFAEKFELMFAGKNWIASIFIPYHGHMHTFPFFISLMLGALTDWNILFEIYVGWGLLVGILLFYVIWLRRLGTLMLVTFAPIISVLLFSLRSAEVILNSFDTTIYYITPLLVILTMELVSRVRVKLLTLTVAITSAVLASFSWGAGLMIWPAAGLILLFREKGWTKVRNIVLWLLAGAGTFFGIAMLRDTPPFPSITTEWLLRMIRFMSILLGGPFLNPTLTEVNYTYAATLGVFLLLTAVLYWRISHNPFQRSTAPWLGVGIYTLLNAPLIALTRMDTSANANLSRYTIVLVPVTINLLVLFGYGMYRFVNQPNSNPVLSKVLRLTPVGIALFFAVASGIASYQTYQLIKGWSPFTRLLVDFTNTYPNLVTPGQFLGLVYMGDDRLVEKDLQLLKKYKLSFFRHTDPGSLSFEKVLILGGNLEPDNIQVGLDRITLDSSGRFVRVEGWAANLAEDRPVPLIFLLDRNGVVETAITGFPRTDIAARFASERLLRTGWEIKIPARKIEQLQFPLQFRFVANNDLAKTVEFPDAASLGVPLALR